MSILPRRLLLAALLLALGCRSEKAAFRFAPAPTASSIIVPVPASPGPAEPVSTVTAAAPLPALPVRCPVAAAPAVVQRPRCRAGLAALGQPVRPLRTETAAVRASPKDDGTEHPTLHLILGGLLVIGGIVGGILLGGWLGLGVGAAVVLGGYYFLGLAVGGKHAWLGVFQEFFNM